MKTRILQHARLLSLVGVLCLPIAALAQTAPLSYHMEPYALDTGLHSAPPSETAPRLVYSAVVEVPDAPWLRLSFSDANLGSGSLKRSVGQDRGHDTMSALGPADPVAGT